MVDMDELSVTLACAKTLLNTVLLVKSSSFHQSFQLQHLTQQTIAARLLCHRSDVLRFEGLMTRDWVTRDSGTSACLASALKCRSLSSTSMGWRCCSIKICRKVLLAGWLYFLQDVLETWCLIGDDHADVCESVEKIRGRLSMFSSLCRSLTAVALVP